MFHCEPVLVNVLRHCDVDILCMLYHGGHVVTSFLCGYTKESYNNEFSKLLHEPYVIHELCKCNKLKKVDTFYTYLNKYDKRCFHEIESFTYKCIRYHYLLRNFIDPFKHDNEFKDLRFIQWVLTSSPYGGNNFNYCHSAMKTCCRYPLIVDELCSSYDIEDVLKDAFIAVCEIGLPFDIVDLYYDEDNMTDNYIRLYLPMNIIGNGYWHLVKYFDIENVRLMEAIISQDNVGMLLNIDDIPQEILLLVNNDKYNTSEIDYPLKRIINLDCIGVGGPNAI